MDIDTGASAASTTSAVAATSQTRDRPVAPVAPGSHPDFDGEGDYFTLGPGIRRLPVTPYQREPGDPIYRPLRIYTLDPSLPKLAGAVAAVNVPYEPLEPGPIGNLFCVDNGNEERGTAYEKADLNQPYVLMSNGYRPSPSDPRFHQQMVYAVCSNVYSAFRAALGRNLSWGFGDAERAAKLVLKPHHGEMRNAYYTNDGGSGAIRFGYYPADEAPSDASMPHGYVFTCLSHDVIAHEVTHALLDGLRAHFSAPSGPDIPAFHEAFADLVAIFQHFSYREVLMTAIQGSRGALEKAELLRSLAQQFGHTTGRRGPLRSAIEEDIEHPQQYDASLEPHVLGSILVSAVFDAFVTIFKRKTQRYIRLATNGSGVLAPGELPYDLQNILAQKASRLASQLLTICIRAIDYCPPVGLNYGDFLRALITADFDIVPDDPWDYRGTLIEAFRRRNIYPRDVSNLSEDALLWRGPRIQLPPVPKLSFADLRFKGDPAQTADVRELRRQACALGRFVSRTGYLGEFGLVADGDPRLQGDRVDIPCVESIRTARRVGPDGQVVFDQVAEIVQQRHVAAAADGPAFSFRGGATVILGPDGKIRYVVAKSVVGAGRVERIREFLQSRAGARFWEARADGYRERGNMFRLTHEH
jgi:hypothetical protein